MWLALAFLVALALGVYLWRRQGSSVPTSLPPVALDPSKAGIHREMSRLEAGWGAYPGCENVINHQASFRVRPGLTKVGDAMRLSVPVNATFTAGAGNLAADTYYYRVAALSAAGETLPSTETSLVLAAPGGVNVNWAAVACATGYKVYGRSAGAELLIASVAAGTLTYLDDGSVTPAGTMPVSNTATTNARVVGAISYPVAADRARLVAMTTTGMAVYDITGGTWTDITDPVHPLTGAAANIGVMRTLESGANVLTIAINGKDAPVVWANDPAVKYRLLGCEVPRTPRCMVVCNNRLVFGNIAELSPQGVDYSNPLDPDHGWGVNETILGDTPGDIVAMRELGNLSFVVYKSDAIYLAQAVAANETFTYQFHSAYNAGPVGPQAVLSVGEGLHMYLAVDGGLYKFDGVQPLLLAEHLRTYVAQQLDRDRMSRSFAFLDPETSLAYYFYPVKGSAEIMSAVVLDLTTGAAWPWRWTAQGFSCGISAGIETGLRISDLPDHIGDITMTFGEMSTLTPTLLVGDATGQFYSLFGYDDDGAAIPFSWATGDSDLGAPTLYKLVTASEHEFEPTAVSQLVGFQLGTSESSNEPAYEDPQTFDLHDIGPYELGHRIAGRKFACRFEGTATQPVTWLRSRVFAAPNGAR